MISAFVTSFLLINESAKPELIKGLPSSSFAALELELNKRVGEQYPDAVKEVELIEELNAMGFTPVLSSADNRYAVYHENAIICQNEWRILWSAREGMAENIRPMITSSCL